VHVTPFVRAKSCTSRLMAPRKFEQLTAPLVQRDARARRRKALRDAKLDPSGLDGVRSLVGRARRALPHLQRAVEGFFGKPPLKDLDPDQVVGARRRDPGPTCSPATAPPTTNWLLLDVDPALAGGWRRMGRPRRARHPRATPPFRSRRRAGVHQPSRTARRAMGDPRGAGARRELVSDNRLARAASSCAASPPLVGGARPRIAVTFQVDAGRAAVGLGPRKKNHRRGQAAIVGENPPTAFSDDEVRAPCCRRVSRTRSRTATQRAPRRATRRSRVVARRHARSARAGWPTSSIRTRRSRLDPGDGGAGSGAWSAADHRAIKGRPSKAPQPRERGPSLRGAWTAPVSQRAFRAQAR